MSTHKINIQPGSPASFQPKVLAASANDSVSWTNNDKVAHWPAPSVAEKTAWLDYQITPDGTSSSISLNPGTYILNYVCALHPTEKGQINVGGKKGAFGDNTKKGAFGGNSKKGAFGSQTQPGK